MNCEDVMNSVGGQLVYQWDAEGRLLEKTRDTETVSFVFDTRDRLAAVTGDTGPAFYGYDPGGLKLESDWGAGGGRRYQWDGGLLLETRTPDDATESRLIRGAGRSVLAYATSSALSFVHEDRLGSAVLETGAGGEALHSAVYGPFGNVRSETGASGLPLGFTGHEDADPVTGLIYMKARWYDSEAGIFISPDPATPDWLNPVTAQEYLYANGNPASFVDPTGMWSSEDAPGFDPVHQMAIDANLPQVSPEERAILKDQQVTIDQEQGNQYQHKHAMSYEGQDKLQAISDSERSLKVQINENINTRYAQENYYSNASKGVKIAAERQMAERTGNIIHLLQDATSPSHEGFQSWDDRKRKTSDHIRHVMEERRMPASGTAVRKRLDAATRWGYDLATGHAAAPKHIFDPITGALNIPEGYLKEDRKKLEATATDGRK